MTRFQYSEKYHSSAANWFPTALIASLHLHRGQISTSYIHYISPLIPLIFRTYHLLLQEQKCIHLHPNTCIEMKCQVPGGTINQELCLVCSSLHVRNVSVWLNKGELSPHLKLPPPARLLLEMGETCWNISRSVFLRKAMYEQLIFS